jgi:hypothetical protein
MEKFLAENFEILGHILGLARGFGISGRKDDVLLPETRASFLNRLDEGYNLCTAAGLRISARHFEEINNRLRSQDKLQRKELISISENLHTNVRLEIESLRVFRLSPEAQHYFDVSDGFGTQVSEAFPTATYDIQEAGNCLALGRATACVYHSMRVLEYGLCALANKFGIPFEHKSWNAVIEPIEKAIRQIKSQPSKPRGWKDNEQFYSEAAAQFMYFKDAWRNYTAHRESKYTEGEAETIFRHVRDFMRHIAKRLREKKAKR